MGGMGGARLGGGHSGLGGNTPTGCMLSSGTGSGSTFNQSCCTSSTGGPSRPSSRPSSARPSQPYSRQHAIGNADARESKAERALKEDGFAVRPIDVNDRMFDALQDLLVTDQTQLGRGKDVQQSYGPYDRLVLSRAWRIDHPRNLDKYDTGKKNVKKERKLLQDKGVRLDDLRDLSAPRGFGLSQANHTSTRPP